MDICNCCSKIVSIGKNIINLIQYNSLWLNCHRSVLLSHGSSSRQEMGFDMVLLIHIRGFLVTMIRFNL
jgi:hypothetical protein